jgi:shikimate kinase
MPEDGSPGSLHRAPAQVRPQAAVAETGAATGTATGAATGTATGAAQAGDGDGEFGNIVLVGLMGAGKSCIGRRLAQKLGRTFVDADAEIEAAAGCTVSEIFAEHGEAYFRDGEKRVIKRLLQTPGQVIATGGGAFMDPETRAAVAEAGVSIWLRADLDLLVKRTSRRNTRPLLRQGDPREILANLMAERDPVYAHADVAVDSADGPPDVTVERVLAALDAYRQAAR